MKIKELIKSLDNPEMPSGFKDFEVRGVACNSKQAGRDSIFVAIKGNQEDGNKFIEEAVENGARAVIVEKGSALRNKEGLRQKAIFIRVKNTRAALARLADAFYGSPSLKIKAVGITGTNGKTTVTYLLEAILKDAGLNPAVIGTINYRFQDKLIPSRNTTPGPLEIESLLSEMLEGGADYCIMEVSSHALHQDRTEGIRFHSAIFTNLTQDHLDYHRTLKSYFNSKVKLFKNLPASSFAIINNDDRHAERIKGLTPARIATYGIDTKADVYARDINFDCRHTELRLITPSAETALSTRLIGRHNVYNMLAAAAWAYKEGIGLPTVKSALEKFCLVPGRLERIEADKGFSVFVDYAHTEDALKNVLETLRPLTRQRIIVVFGCGGERDRIKRPKMGRLVSKMADYAVITNDNPRSEDPLKIIADIKRGIEKDNYCVIADRYSAIKESLSLAKRGDIVLVAGKGHENYQVIKGRVIDFDDRKAVRECLKSLS